MSSVKPHQTPATVQSCRLSAASELHASVSKVALSTAVKQFSRSAAGADGKFSIRRNRRRKTRNEQLKVRIWEELSGNANSCLISSLHSSISTEFVKKERMARIYLVVSIQKGILVLTQGCQT